ncbi:hypothetical protein DSO57_1016537 [Entomophthora muscae]|uniref:Uncharacterized protein n=1 Tax=Entomophthora muscae TaxID=34485 RepID=A0ACC2RJH2_9FUNG|nr:hypothetical protein DSO57_1016537 [Entomophthora muscae]
MSHLGSYVPAKECTLHPIDHIFTSLFNRESVSMAQSGFCQSLQRIALFLDECTNKSIIFLDEFGKGTNIAGLFCGLIIYIFNMNREKQPKIVASTHFYEIFRNNLLGKYTNRVNWLNMQVKEKEKSSLDFTFKVQKGSAESSWGAHCALMAGLPEEIVERAKEITLDLTNFKVPKMTLPEKDLRRISIYNSVAKKLIETEITPESVGEFCLWVSSVTKNS